jgi:hypothetical protein
MTPTEKITSIHSIKIKKAPDLDKQITEEARILRNLVNSQSRVWDEIEEWMQKAPNVNEKETKEFRNRDGK